MMDLSDGIGRDLSRLCRASGLGAEVEAAALPWPAAEDAPELAWQLAWGDDYELLFACAPSARRAVLDLGTAWGRPIAVVGACTSDRALTLRGADWPLPLYSHFEEVP
jgi:thiamine-monophosphate kinase